MKKLKENLNKKQGFIKKRKKKEKYLHKKQGFMKA